MLLKMKDGILYGPVNSRRLGKSLGINLSPAKQKLCSFAHSAPTDYNCIVISFFPDPQNIHTDTTSGSTYIRIMKWRFATSKIFTNYNIGRHVFRGSVVYGEGTQNYMNDATVDIGVVSDDDAPAANSQTPCANAATTSHELSVGRSVAA